MAKSRLREKELRRRRHRYWKRRKQRIKQQILEARLRKLEMKQKAAAEGVPSTTSKLTSETQAEPQLGEVSTGQ